MKSTRLLLRFTFVSILSFGIATGCAHLSDPCENNLIERLPSPDGKLVLSLYYRKCGSKDYTTASIEQPPSFIVKRGDVVCYLMFWGDKHPVESLWTDSENISIKTSDKLERIDRLSGEPTSCRNITIHYDFQTRRENQNIDDPQIVEQLNGVISDMAPCIDSYYKAANPNNNPSQELNFLAANDERRSALESLLGQVHDSHCRVPLETFKNLHSLSLAFDLKPRYIDGIQDLVVR